MAGRMALLEAYAAVLLRDLIYCTLVPRLSRFYFPEVQDLKNFKLYTFPALRPVVCIFGNPYAIPE